VAKGDGWNIRDAQQELEKIRKYACKTLTSDEGQRPSFWGHVGSHHFDKHTYYGSAGEWLEHVTADEALRLRRTPLAFWARHGDDTPMAVAGVPPMIDCSSGHFMSDKARYLSMDPDEATHVPPKYWPDWEWREDRQSYYSARDQTSSDEDCAGPSEPVQAATANQCRKTAKRRKTDTGYGSGTGILCPEFPVVEIEPLVVPPSYRNTGRKQSAKRKQRRGGRS